MVQTPTVYGDIKSSDDYTHPLGPEPNFNDSMYFNFFDNAKGLGGFLRVGNRANERYAEVTLTLYQPDGTVLFNYKRPEIETNDAFDAGGMRLRDDRAADPPSHNLRGHRRLPDRAQPDERTRSRRSCRTRTSPSSIDLVHEAVGPVYGTRRRASHQGDPEKQFAKAHYEQHMRVTGTVAVDGQTVQIDGLGLRDHSWGPRYWQNIYSYRWLTCAFGPDLSVMVSEIRQTPESRLQNGVVIRDGKLERVVAVDIDSQLQPGTPYHTGMTARLGLESGETVTVEGTVKSFIPLRNRREGHVTHIGEGMTEYRCLGHTGLGISEYLDQVE